MTAMPEIITAVADKATDKASAAMTIPKRASSIARELNHQLWASYKTQGSFGPLFGEFVFEQFGRQAGRSLGASRLRGADERGLELGLRVHEVAQVQPFDEARQQEQRSKTPLSLRRSVSK